MQPPFSSPVKKLFALLLCIALTALGHAQNQKEADSLAVIYQNGDYTVENKLSLLQTLAEEETETDKKLYYSLQLIVTAKEMDSVSYEIQGYLQQGNAHRLNGDMTKALESYFEGQQVAIDNRLPFDEASIDISIADVYSIMGDSDTAVSYYTEALTILEQSDDPYDLIALASAQLNLGDEFYNQKKLDSALHYFTKSAQIFKDQEYPLGEAYNLGNVGLVLAEMGDAEKAEENLNQAIATLEELEDYYPICVYLNAMADVYAMKGDDKRSLEYLEESLRLSKKYRLKDQIGDTYLKLSEYFESKRRYKETYAYYKDYIAYRDSVANVRNVQQMFNVRTQNEVSRKQVEIDLVNQQKKTQVIINIAVGIGLVLIGVLAFFLFRRNKFILKTKKIIEEEKTRSDDLLKNILPEETAEELKEKGSVDAKKFDKVSVLFTDFNGFTQQSQNLSPEVLVESIDYYFSKFDEIVEKYDLEKIKTIGDAYMCAGGLPHAQEQHEVNMCKAALDIVAFVKKTSRDPDHKLAKFGIRVGISTGPVVAGVVGTKKFAYDIWGDTVNVAARMESSSDEGMVNISEETYAAVKGHHEFDFEQRGAIEAKGKGKIDMYFVKRAW